MLSRIIHIVDSTERINFGIYNAAVFSSGYLSKKQGVVSCLWVCDKEPGDKVVLPVPVLYMGTKPSDAELTHLIRAERIDADTSIFISHGCWKTPTLLGSLLQQRGFKWIYTPHGMLEPWSMNHKRWKKKLYFNLFEKRRGIQANGMRAVSKSEQQNLQSLFNRPVELVENGIQLPDYTPKPKGTKVFLFMARLHFKKGILPLVAAWAKHMKGAEARLIIAGPDEGELEKIRPYLSDSIQYAGPIYGDAKTVLFQSAHYYVLPSYSEGFPTSVVEAMGYGLIPLISKGCNFPQVFEKELGYPIEPDEESIGAQLLRLKDRAFDEALSFNNYQFIKQHNTEEYLGEKLYSLYTRVLQATQ